MKIIVFCACILMEVSDKVYRIFGSVIGHDNWNITSYRLDNHGWVLCPDHFLLPSLLFNFVPELNSESMWLAIHVCL